MAVKHYCDVCGKVGKVYSINYNGIIKDDDSIDTTYNSDLCEECYNKYTKEVLAFEKKIKRKYKINSTCYKYNENKITYTDYKGKKTIKKMLKDYDLGQDLRKTL
jgi:hypothetical protein